MDARNVLKNGETYSFYGVHDYFFKLGDIVFVATEDTDDGYRSYLSSIPIVNPKVLKGLVFFDQPLVNVKCHLDEESLWLEDESGWVWLEICTDYSDNYYPCFVFNYSPNPNTTKFAKPINNLNPTEIHPETFI